MVIAPNASDNVVITIDPLPAQAQILGGNRIICGADEPTTILVAANINITDEGIWTQTGGPAGLIFTPNDENTTTVSGFATPPVNGTIIYEVQWEVSSGEGDCNSTDMVQIIVYGEPSDADITTSDEVFCDATSFSVEAVDPSPSTGLWLRLSGPSQGSFADPFSPSTVYNNPGVGVYQFQWTTSNGPCTDVDVVTLENFAPLDGGQSNISVCVEGEPVLNANASGGNGDYTYQWQVSDTNCGGTWSDIGGETGATYTVPTSVTENTGMYYYRVVINDSGPCDEFTSTCIVVTVVEDPTISGTPTTSNICRGGSASFTVTASGGTPGLTYQWQFESSPGVWANVVNGTPAGVNYSAATTATLGITTNNGTAVIGSHQYRVLVSASGIGCTTAESGSYTLNIFADPTISVQPVGDEICSGETYDLSVTASGTAPGALLYQWQTSTTLAGTYTNIGGATLSTYTTPTLTATRYYRVIITQAESGCSTTSNVATVQVNPIPTITSASSDLICDGDALNYTITSSVPGSSFVWVGELTSGMATGITTTNQTTNSITDVLVNTGTEPAVVTYTITPTGPAPTSCEGAPFEFVVTVEPEPEASADPISETICDGDETNIALVEETTGSVAMTFTWTAAVQTAPMGGSLGFAPSCASGCGDSIEEMITNSGTTPGVVRYTITPSYGDCDGDEIIVDITVNPTAQVNDPGDQVVCNDDATIDIEFTTNNSGGTTTYSWVNNTTSIGLAAGGSGDIPSFTATNAGTVPVTATITVTPSFENDGVSCDGPTMQFTITVNPNGQVDEPADQEVCHDEETTVTFTTANTGGTTTYAWTNDNVAIGLAANGSGNISFDATNTGTEPISATITVTPTFSNAGEDCIGDSEQFEITINPAGQINAIASQQLCNGEETDEVIFGTTNTGGNTTFTWTNDNTDTGLKSSSDVTEDFSSGSWDPSFFEIGGGTGEANTSGYRSTGATRGTLRTVEEFVPTAANPLRVEATLTYFDESIAFIGTRSDGIPYSEPSNSVFLRLHNFNTGQSNLQAGFDNLDNGNFTDAFYDDPVRVVIIDDGTNINVILTNTVTNVVNALSGTSAFSSGSNHVVFSGDGNYWSDIVVSQGVSSFPEFTAINTTTDPIVSTIEVTPYFEGCAGPSESFTITVDPSPIVTSPSTITICSGEAVAYEPTSNIPGTTFTWTAANTVGTVVGFTPMGSGNINDVLSNVGPADGAVTYTITPVGDTPEACPGSPFLLVVEVLNCNPALGLAKNLVNVTNNGNSTYDVTFEFVVRNYGNVDLENINVTDDLQTVFGSNCDEIDILSLTASGFSINPDYDGITDFNLLLVNPPAPATNELEVGEEKSILLTLRLTDCNSTGIYENNAVATAVTPFGDPIADNSINGTDPDPDGDDDPSNNESPTPVSLAEEPYLGLSKRLVSTPTNNGDGTYNLTFEIRAVNRGNVNLTDVQITDDLASVLETDCDFEVVSLTSEKFAVNTNYDGDSDLNLLFAGSTLAAWDEGAVLLTILVGPCTGFGPFNNSATISAETPLGDDISDISQDGSEPDPAGSGDPQSQNEPTPFDFDCLLFVDCPALNQGVYPCTGDIPEGAESVAEFNAQFGVNSIEVFCGEIVEVSFVDTNNGGSGCAASPLVITRTYTVDDTTNDIQIECVVEYIIIDNINPIITTPPSDLILECNDSGNAAAIAAWVASNGGGTFSDNCTVAATVSFTAGATTSLCGSSSTTQYVLTVTDDCGNSQSSIANLILIDTQAPDITLPTATSIVDCSVNVEAALNTWLASASADDACAGNVSVNYSLQNIVNDCDGTVTRIQRTYLFSANDGCGNISTASAIFTVVDVIAPVITAPSDLVINCDILGQGGLFSGITSWLQAYEVVEACQSYTVTNDFDLDVIPNTCGDNILVTWTVVDGCGATSSASANLILTPDTDGPQFVNCPVQDITVNVDVDLCASNVTFSTPIAIDCNGPVSVVQVANGNGDLLLSGSTFPLGTTEIVFEATDDCGNISECIFNITVIDSQLPSIACPSNDVVVCGDGICEWEGTAAIAPTGVDNCPGAVITYDITGATIADGTGSAEGVTFNIGTSTIIYTITNGSNVATCSFNVVVEDCTAPIINTCPTDIAIDALTSSCENEQTLTLPVATDNCSDALDLVITYIVYNPDNSISGPFASSSNDYTFAAGNSIVEWTVTDLAGNSTICQQSVTVNAILPTVNAGADAAICESDSPYPLEGSATNEISTLWTTNGTGIFGDPTDLMSELYSKCS